MNQLPIYKIFVAGFAFVLTHWKKIIEIFGAILTWNRVTI
jgi:hypothetical protein